MFSPFFFQEAAAHPALHSFPTRRSSDLAAAVLRREHREYSHRRGGPAERHVEVAAGPDRHCHPGKDRKSTRLNSSHITISYAVFCLKKKKTNTPRPHRPTSESACTRSPP